MLFYAFTSINIFQIMELKDYETCLNVIFSLFVNWFTSVLPILWISTFPSSSIPILGNSANTVHGTMHTAHNTLYTTHYKVHTKHYTMQTLYCTLHIAHCTLHIVHCGKITFWGL